MTSPLTRLPWCRLPLLVAVLVWFACAQTTRAAIAVPLDQQGRWLLDQTGRVVMLRGGNLMLPGNTGEQGSPDAETPRKLADKGFNGVRLVLFFDRLMPTPGIVDEDYLAEISDAVAGYRDAGVYVLLDVHQDEYGPAVGIRGLPAWATFPGEYEPCGCLFPPATSRIPPSRPHSIISGAIILFPEPVQVCRTSILKERQPWRRIFATSQPCSVSI